MFTSTDVFVHTCTGMVSMSLLIIFIVVAKPRMMCFGDNGSQNIVGWPFCQYLIHSLTCQAKRLRCFLHFRLHVEVELKSMCDLDSCYLAFSVLK